LDKKDLDFGLEDLEKAPKDETELPASKKEVPDEKFELGSISATSMPEPPKVGEKKGGKKDKKEKVTEQPEQPEQKEPIDDFHFNELPELPEGVKELESEKVDLEPVQEEVPVEQEKPISEQVEELKEELPEQVTPLSEVKGVGPKTEKQLRKIKIKTAEDLANTEHEHIVKKTKIPKHRAKKLVSHAKKVVKKAKKATTTAAVKKPTGISVLVQELEKEKEELHKLKRRVPGQALAVKGHEEILELLEKLEKKKLELLEYENNLRDKEEKLDGNRETYKRDAEYIDKLKRRLDHDIRERTQYLINLEKEFFKKGQELAKRQSEAEIREQQVKDKESLFKEREGKVIKLEHELEDRELTVKAKEDKLKSMLREIEKQEALMKEREQGIEKRELEYLKKLETLETHEKKTDEYLRKKEDDLDKQHKELEYKIKKVHKKEKKVDIEDRALDYAKDELEEKKTKLEDDEFKQYLHEKLGTIKEEGISMEDIEVTHNIRVPSLGDKPETIYTLIERCKHLVKSSRSTEAKLFYNKIRDKFYHLHFKSNEEQESLHNVIRALYDEINLVDLGNQNGA
ncbi:hypothetical protein JXC34_01580, partial [Candidatus Woesearchaeota archaeon]|nr:hypothetical protein [Candidatus Woesearchaeota archaeon]